MSERWPLQVTSSRQVQWTCRGHAETFTSSEIEFSMFDALTFHVTFWPQQKLTTNCWIYTLTVCDKHSDKSSILVLVKTRSMQYVVIFVYIKFLFCIFQIEGTSLLNNEYWSFCTTFNQFPFDIYSIMRTATYCSLPSIQVMQNIDIHRIPVRCNAELH